MPDGQQATIQLLWKYLYSWVYIFIEVTKKTNLRVFIPYCSIQQFRGFLISANSTKLNTQRNIVQSQYSIFIYDKWITSNHLSWYMNVAPVITSSVLHCCIMISFQECINPVGGMMPECSTCELGTNHINVRWVICHRTPYHRPTKLDWRRVWECRLLQDKCVYPELIVALGSNDTALSVWERWMKWNWN